jgi:hypothetical protein
MELKQWQIELIQHWAKEAAELANSEDRAGAFYSGRAQGFQTVLDLIAGEEGIL